MPIDTMKKILFIHIPKTGGSSVEKALNLHPHQVQDAFVSLSGTGKHLQHLTFKQINELDRKAEVNACKKFCIIRNPIDRFGSEFRWRKKIGHPLTKDMNEADFAEHLYKLKINGDLHNECHFRYQSDYFYINGVPSPDVEVFRLEEGMEKVEAWINSSFGLDISVSHSNATNLNKAPLAANVKDIVKEVYKEDALKLGYEL